jgi:hypothetical protein
MKHVYYYRYPICDAVGWVARVELLSALARDGGGDDHPTHLMPTMLLNVH